MVSSPLVFKFCAKCKHYYQTAEYAEQLNLAENKLDAIGTLITRMDWLLVVSCWWLVISGWLLVDWMIKKRIDNFISNNLNVF